MQRAKKTLIRLFLVGAVALQHSWSPVLRLLVIGIFLAFCIVHDHFEKWPRLARVKWQTWLMVMAAGFFADILTTHLFLHFTVLPEGNPLMKMVMDYFSVTGGLLLSKASLLLLAIIVGIKSGERAGRRATLCFGALFYGAVTIWNIFAIGVVSLVKAVV